MSKYTFNMVSAICEKRGVVLVWNEQEFDANFKNTKTIIPIYSSCNHLNKVQFNNLIYLNTGITCKQCISETCRRDLIELAFDGNLQEYKVIRSLADFLSNDFTFKITNEGCLADFCIKPNNVEEDLWLPVQLKTTTSKSAGMYNFSIRRQYNGMIILLFYIDPYDLHKVWILDGDKVTAKYINIGIRSSIYDKYEIGTSELSLALTELYTSRIKFTLEDLNIPISEQMKNEQIFKKIRESIFPTLCFDYADVDNRVFDVIINKTYKVQDKVLTYTSESNKHYYFCNLGRNSKSKNGKPYKIGDNDYYWLFLPDKSGAYIIPENELIKNRYISTNTTEEIRQRVAIWASDTKTSDSWIKDHFYNFEKKEDIYKVQALFDPSGRPIINPNPDIQLLEFKETYIETINLTKRIFNKIRKDNMPQNIPKINGPVSDDYIVKKKVLEIFQNVIDANYVNDMIGKIVNKLVEKEQRKKANTRHFTFQRVPLPKDINRTNSLGIAISQYTLDNIHIRDYTSISLAARLSGAQATCITYCLRGKFKQAGGYIWKYKDQSS